MHTHTHPPTQTHKHHRDIQTATRRPYRDTQHKETHHTNPYTQTHTHTHTARIGGNPMDPHWHRGAALKLVHKSEVSTTLTQNARGERKKSKRHRPALFPAIDRQ